MVNPDGMFDYTGANDRYGFTTTIITAPQSIHIPLDIERAASEDHITKASAALREMVADSPVFGGMDCVVSPYLPDGQAYTCTSSKGKASIMGNPVTIESIQEAMRDLDVSPRTLRATTIKPTFEQVVEAVRRALDEEGGQTIERPCIDGAPFRKMGSPETETATGQPFWWSPVDKLAAFLAIGYTAIGIIAAFKLGWL